jgi:glycolate oxidase FAD binding subunit
MNMDNGYLDHLIDDIQSKPKLIARGGYTKTGIKTPPEVNILDLSSISGIREYNPSEYTFTALAGTRLKDIDRMLSDNGQFLPFDPPLTKKGATLGGTVASNLSGPMRYQFGGVRDFILGVKFLDGQGQLIKSGGKVVKNAAGFDISKLMVGSLGSLGTLIEFSFKVFPRPREFITTVSKFENLPDALDSLIKLTSSPFEILCLDLAPIDNCYQVEIRMGGSAKLFRDRITHLGEHIQIESTLQGEQETKFWEDINEFNWVPQGTNLVKVPLIPKYVSALDDFLEQHQAVRRYSAGVNVAWIVWPGSMDSLDQKLKELDLLGLSILGATDLVRMGSWKDNVFYDKIKDAIDPSGIWVKV